MPCYQCINGKWRIGSGRCIFKSKKICLAALRAYYANQDDILPFNDSSILDLIRLYLEDKLDVPDDAQEELNSLIEKFSERLLQLPNFFVED